MGLGKLLETSAKIHHESVFPSDLNLESAISVLHDHESLIKMDPYLVSYHPLPALASSPTTKCYKVFERCDNLPKMFSPDQNADLQYTDLPNGIHTWVNSSMGLISDTHLTIEKRKNGTTVIVEDAVVRCSRLWMPIVKSQCEANWREVHRKFLKIFRERQNQIMIHEDGKDVKDVEVVMMIDALNSPVPAA